MKLEAYWMEPCIIVLDTNQKQKILETIERQKKLYRCKFLTMRELLLAWYGTYHIETLVAIQKKKVFNFFRSQQRDAKYVPQE